MMIESEWEAQSDRIRDINDDQVRMGSQSDRKCDFNGKGVRMGGSFRQDM